MADAASDLARRLARNVETVCRHYLSNGHREGQYWLVGDVENTPGRSLYVRLRGPDSGKGAAGKWTDAATGQHGDLLDLIAANRGLRDLRDALDEARRFLALPRPDIGPPPLASASARSPQAARRLIAMTKPIGGTLAETYLHRRGITDLRNCTALRFHRNCFYRPDAADEPGVREAWPALIAAITDAAGAIVGAHRTWLDPDTGGKAPIATPRRAMGNLLGHGVRFGPAHDVLAVGEGVESVLSLRMAIPSLPAIACLSANHLARFRLPIGLRRLYIARDNDQTGRDAADYLSQVAISNGVEPLMLDSIHGDLNEDLSRLGLHDLSKQVHQQLAPDDAPRFSEWLDDRVRA